MDNHILIRRVKPGDADEIVRIYSAITKKPVTPDFKPLIQEHVRKRENACFAAELQGKVVGFMISHSPSGGFGLEQSAWITMVGVSPKFMGQGIGKQMAQKVFEFYKAKGISNIYTTVRWYSGDLLSFFKTLGFEKSDFINLRYYGKFDAE